MSSQTTALNNGQQAIIHTDLSKIFIGDNRYTDAVYNNSSYVTVNLAAGTVMGRIATTGKVIPLVPTASDGSQFPVGVLAKDYSIDSGVNQTVSLCIAGDVAEEKIIIGGGGQLNDIISSRRLRDRIAGDTHGIKLVTTTEMTATDNE
jgi:hypothetical protein